MDCQGQRNAKKFRQARYPQASSRWNEKSKIKDKKSKLQVPDSIGTKILTARGENYKMRLPRFARNDKE